MAERDGQIAGLSRVISEFRDSTSWKITAPVRWPIHQVKRLIHLFRIAPKIIRQYGGTSSVFVKTIRVVKRDGISGLKERIRNFVHYPRKTGIAVVEPVVSDGPLISIVVPIYNTPVQYLDECIWSVRKQNYLKWELILVDDYSTNNEVRELMNHHATSDSRIRTVFRETNGHISKTINSGLELAKGDYFSVLDHDDTLDYRALNFVARAINENGCLDYIYTDEDKLSADGEMTFGPFYKPDWSPEYMLSMMYTCHMSVFRTDLVRKVGGYRSDYDGAQDYDLTLRIIANSDSSKILHIPHVLYHWRAWENSTAESLYAKPYVVERQKATLQEYLNFIGDKGHYLIQNGPLPGHHACVFLPRGNPLVSIVIPTANGEIFINGRTEKHINAVVSSIFDKSTYSNYEIIIVHNGDLTPSQEVYFNSESRIRLVHYEDSNFSLARKINLGCAQAAGEYLVILNDDIRVISEDWIERMLGHVQRDGVGVVGPKLLFPNETVQHAGVVLLGGLPGHVYYEEPDHAYGYALGAVVDRNYLAVTGACQMTPKYLWDQFGGYSEKYPLNYNDVDYCLKLHQAGYRAVYAAHVKLYHYEGVSKEGGRSVATREMTKFLEDWHEAYPFDPYYNPNLSQLKPYGE